MKCKPNGAIVHTRESNVCATLLCSLEEGGVVTDCSILTLNSDEILDFEFNSENVISKIITKVTGSFILIVQYIHMYTYM